MEENVSRDAVLSDIPNIFLEHACNCTVMTHDNITLYVYDIVIMQCSSLVWLFVVSCSIITKSHDDAIIILGISSFVHLARILENQFCFQEKP